MKRKVLPLNSRLLFAPALLGRVDQSELMSAFARHDSDDWGIVPESVREANQLHLKIGGELVSEFQSKNGTRFKIRTTPDSKFTHFESAET
jgi:hypothetical protein